MKNSISDCARFFFSELKTIDLLLVPRVHAGINYIEIGPNVLLGPNVFVADHSHEFSDISKPIRGQGATEPGKVIIEEGCWFGHNSVVIAHKGREVRIGRNSVIGANAVVTKSFPPFSILGGVPAHKLSHSLDRQGN